MKRILNKFKNNSLFSFILGGILFGSVVYGANIYQSNEVEYTPTDASWEVSNVSDAINSLYDMKTELENIKSVGDATASDIADGKTAVVKGVEVTGTKKDTVEPITIPSILHNRNGEKGNNYIATTKVTLNVKDYTTLTIGSVSGDNGTYRYSVTSNTGASLSKKGTSDITDYDTITFSIGEVYNVTHSAGDVGFYNIVIS